MNAMVRLRTLCAYRNRFQRPIVAAKECLIAPVRITSGEAAGWWAHEVCVARKKGDLENVLALKTFWRFQPYQTRPLFHFALL